MACLRPRARRLEKRKELKLKTWYETRFSATFRPALQLVSVSGTRELLGSDGFQASPMKTAKVKRELTLTMASKAVTWMLVPGCECNPPPPCESISYVLFFFFFVFLQIHTSLIKQDGKPQKRKKVFP